MASWIDGAIFYHIYPLGLLDAPKRDDWGDGLEHRLPGLLPWIAHLSSLGCNAVYLGPVFESVSHGYDTTDYFTVDPRLGDTDDLQAFVLACHEHNVHVVFDGVFNHVGRNFFAFRDLLEHGEESAYRDWFVDVRFGHQSPNGDPFTYYAYEGNFDMPRLNVQHPDVRQHLFDAVRMWFAEFWADGIRFDAVEQLDRDVVGEFCAVAREAKPDCWLVGEVLGSDYREWSGPGMLDSCMNYEAFKGLHSSFNDRNMHEIAWSLNRQFGPDGIYRDLTLYSFADNHDVNRVATLLRRGEDLASLYTLLYTMPGLPSIYYGSEWGITGDKGQADDAALRPALAMPPPPEAVMQPWLLEFIARLAAIRQSSAAIRRGDYTELHVAGEQLAFKREADGEIAIIVVNAWEESTGVEFPAALDDGTVLTDALDPTASFTVEAGRIRIPVTPNSARILLNS
jgi:glycosidase